MTRPKRPRDTNQLAKRIVDLATGEADGPDHEVNEGRRRGGIRGGKARADKLSAKERSLIARNAASIRWEKGS